MAAIVAPGICRFVVNGEYASRPVVNILDMDIGVGGSAVSRSDAIYQKAGDILNDWTENILPILDDNYLAASVSWIDLNTLDGPTGERNSTDERTWPLVGTRTGQGMPGAMAFRVNKNTVAARGQRQGRMYLCGVQEADTDDSNPNVVAPARIAVMNTALSNFLDDINEGGGGVGDYSANLVVVHTKDGVFTSASDVTALTVDTRLGTQVRRLRG